MHITYHKLLEQLLLLGCIASICIITPSTARDAAKQITWENATFNQEHHTYNFGVNNFKLWEEDTSFGTHSTYTGHSLNGIMIITLAKIIVHLSYTF